MKKREKRLVKEIASVLNRVSRENESNTSDLILAEYMVLALEAFERGIQRREKWYGRDPGPQQEKIND